MIARRKQLGTPLPRVKTVDQPTPEQIAEYHHRFDVAVPEWAGLLNPKPEGTPGAKFYRDEITGTVTRASDGHIVTIADQRMAMALLTERRRGK